MGFTSSLLKKTEEKTLFFSCACCKWGRHLYTTTAPSRFIPASYFYLSATLQTMSIIVVNLQDNRTFKVFIWLSLLCSLRHVFPVEVSRNLRGTWATGWEPLLWTNSAQLQIKCFSAECMRVSVGFWRRSFNRIQRFDTPSSNDVEEWLKNRQSTVKCC